MARDAFAQLAEPIDGPAVKTAQFIAREYSTHLVFGMPEREESTKRLFNTSILVAPDGKVASYRKVYLANFGPFEEGLYFGRGDGLTLVETKLGRSACSSATTPFSRNWQRRMPCKARICSRSSAHLRPRRSRSSTESCRRVRSRTPCPSYMRTSSARN